MLVQKNASAPQICRASCVPLAAQAPSNEVQAKMLGLRSARRRFARRPCVAESTDSQGSSPTSNRKVAISTTIRATVNTSNILIQTTSLLHCHCHNMSQLWVVAQVFILQASYGLTFESVVCPISCRTDVPEGCLMDCCCICRRYFKASCGSATLPG